MGIVAFSPLAGGMLTDKYINGIPNGSRATKSEFLKKDQITPELLNKVKKLNDIAANRGQSMAQMALAWVAREPAGNLCPYRRQQPAANFRQCRSSKQYRVLSRRTKKHRSDTGRIKKGHSSLNSHGQYSNN